MVKKKRFVFLSKKFYNTYPISKYPEMEQKNNRPYIQVHPYVLWTDKANHCSVDFSKAVVITDDSYIDSSIEPHLFPCFFKLFRIKGWNPFQVLR